MKKTSPLSMRQARVAPTNFPRIWATIKSCLVTCALSLGTIFFFFLNMFHVCQCFHDCSAEKRTKYVAVRWVGSSITPTLRAKAMEQARIIATSYIKVFHIEILAHSQDEVTTSLVNTRLTKAAGANYGS